MRRTALCSRRCDDDSLCQHRNASKCSLSAVTFHADGKRLCNSQITVCGICDDWCEIHDARCERPGAASGLGVSIRVSSDVADEIKHPRRLLVDYGACMFPVSPSAEICGNTRKDVGRSSVQPYWLDRMCGHGRCGSGTCRSIRSRTLGCLQTTWGNCETVGQNAGLDCRGSFRRGARGTDWKFFFKVLVSVFIDPVCLLLFAIRATAVGTSNYIFVSFSFAVSVHKQPLREEEIGAICYEVLHGLEYLHNQGYIHRDVKAGNILLTDSAAVKLGQ